MVRKSRSLPSEPARLSNAQLAVLAAYLAGASKGPADTEDVAVKAAELAPGRFSWRKYPEQINIETIRKRLFALIGQDVTPGAITQLKDDIKHGRFEDSVGWSKAGTLWWHFQADRPTAKAGTRSVPTFVFNLTSGEWDVRSVDGLKLGAARIENGFMSGFRTAFLALGVSNRDFVQFDFDIAERRVFVRIVGDDPEEYGRAVEKDEFDEEADIFSGD